MFLVRMSVIGLAATKGFTHGRISFDPVAKTVQFSRHFPLPLPDFAETVKEGAILTFGLLAPDGAERPQKREVLILKSKNGQLFVPGISKTPSNNARKDGWRTRTLKFRAYFTHPGIETEPATTPHNIELPQWLHESINRQRRFRNRLVKLCLDARDACCPVNYDDFTRFVKETVLPAVNDFNNALGRSKDKISAKELRVESPSIFVLTRFGGYLQYLERAGKPAPVGLAEQISAFISDLKINFKPINQFQRNLDAIVRQERYLDDLSFVEKEDEDGKVRIHRVYRRLTDPVLIEVRRSELELRDWEWKPIAAAFKATLKARKTLGLPFSQGWPKYSDEKSTDWGIHYYFNNGGSEASLLIDKGVRGIRLEAGIPPDRTGRNWKSNGRRARRELNPAQIRFFDTLSGNQFTFHFVVLRHQIAIPDEALFKEWKLIHNRTGLWLCFVVQGRFAKPTAKNGDTAAVHIGWRKEGSELWPAIVFDPTCRGRDSFRRVVIDTELPPEKSDEHTPFRINMGPSRQGRRSPYWINGSKPHLRAEPQSTGAVQIQDTWIGIEWLGRWRDERKDIFKSLLSNSLNPVPDGLHRAGVRALHRIGEGLTDPILVKAYKAWAVEDNEIGELTTEFSARVASRLSNGYSRVAHDICRSFSEHGVSTIAVQDSLLARVAKNNKRKSTNPEALRGSQTNRHRVAPGQLLMKLSCVADVYGLNVVRVENAHISRVHTSGDPECNHVNPPSAQRIITCEKCGKLYDQDENACRNMVARHIIEWRAR